MLLKKIINQFDNFDTVRCSLIDIFKSCFCDKIILQVLEYESLKLVIVMLLHFMVLKMLWFLLYYRCLNILQVKLKLNKTIMK